MFDSIKEALGFDTWGVDPDLGNPGCDSNQAVVDKINGYGR